MTPWPTVKYFASWLRLCPYQDISGGKVLRTKTKKTTSPATQAFCMAAQAASRFDSALGPHYRRMRAKLGRFPSDSFNSSQDCPYSLLYAQN